MTFKYQIDLRKITLANINDVMRDTFGEVSFEGAGERITQIKDLNERTDYANNFNIVSRFGYFLQQVQNRRILRELGLRPCKEPQKRKVKIVQLFGKKQKLPDTDLGGAVIHEQNYEALHRNNFGDIGWELIAESMGIVTEKKGVALISHILTSEEFSVIERCVFGVWKVHDIRSYVSGGEIETDTYMKNEMTEYEYALKYWGANSKNSLIQKINEFRMWGG